MSKRMASIVALAVAAAWSVALAHEGAVGIAKERMDAMEGMGKVSKDIARKISANRNLASIADDVAKIRATAEKIPGYFPVGSGTGVTKAKPEIWQKWELFQERAAHVAEQSDKLAAAAAGGDPRAIRTQFMALERACAACHDQFRAKDH
jgi:cytochrome c556